MKPITKYIFLILFLLFSGLAICSNEAFADNTASCKKGEKQSCKVSDDCFPNRNGKHYTSSARGNNIGGDCVKKASANGCYNSNPTSCSGSYNGLGNRGESRNHYGSDIGSAACGKEKGKIQVYAPADGEIVWIGVSSGGGRTMIIEHTKKCSGGGKFKTIYRHLAAYLKTGGSVKKGVPVGIEGGSNCYNRSFGEACICDNKEQSVGHVYSGCNKAHAYAIHLHMETINSGFNGSNSYVGGEMENVMKSYCGGVQALCGDCPVDTSNCVGKNDTSFDGTTANLDGVQDGFAGASGSDGGGYTSDKCNFQDYLDSQNCTFCELFKKFFNVSSTMAKLANDKLAGPTKTLVSIGFVIWLCIYLLRHLTSYSQVTTGEMLKGILFQGFRVAVVIIALSGAIYEIMDLTLNPVMETGLDFGKTLNRDSTCDDGATYMQGIIGYDETTGFPKPDNAASDQIGGLSKHMGESLICSLKNLEDSTGFMMSLGKYSICLSWERFKLWKIFPSLGYFSTGLFLWITGLFLLLSFPWCLIDCLLQLCVAVALIPCAVGAYAFKITAQYLKLIWSMFMNALFNFVFMAIIVYIINKNLQDWIGYTPGSNPDPEIFITAYKPEGLAWWGIGFVKMLLVCIFSWTFFDEAKSMANEFARGIGFHDLGRKVGSTVTSAAFNKVIKPGTAMAGSLALSSAKKIGREINREFGDSARNFANKGRYKVLKFFGAKETTNPNGTTSVSSSFNFMGTKHSHTFTKDGDGNYTKTSQTHRRSNYEKYFNVTTNEDGNVNVTARKSFMGMTMFGLFGKQAMKEEKDPVTGRTIWRTADKDASRQRELTIDDDGNIKFNKYSNLDDKNIFTQAMHYRSGKDHPGVQKGITKVKNDNVLKMTEMFDDMGNLTGRHLEFRNTVDGLIKQDGTTNLNSMNYLINQSTDKERAYEALIVAHMQQRNMNIDETFNNRTVIVNKDQSVTIMQTNNDGSRQEITAKIDGNQMILHEKTFDSAGNPIRYQKNNGIQSLTETYEKQEDGTYNVSSKQDFSDYYKQKNLRTPPLNENGNWGYNINRDKAMKGFTQQNFDEHVQQLMNEQTTSRSGQPLNFKNMSQAEIDRRMNT